VLTQRQADEARLRAERVMKQREHEILDSFAALRRLLDPGAGAPRERAKLPKHANEARRI